MPLRVRAGLKIITINIFVLLALASPLWLPVVITQYGIRSKSLRSGFVFDLSRWSYLELYRQGIVGLNPCFVADKELTYIGLPGSKCYSENIEFSVNYNFNSFGVRDSEQALVSPKTIVLGDSHAMGWGVDPNARFSALLGIQYQPVLNLAISSYGTARQLKILDRFASQYPDKYKRVDSVIIQYCGNDYGENSSTGNSKYQSDAYLTYSQPAKQSKISGLDLTNPLALGQFRHHARSTRKLVPHFWAEVIKQANAKFSTGSESYEDYNPLEVPFPKHGLAFVEVFKPYADLLANKKITIVISTDHGLWNKKVFHDLNHSMPILKKVLSSSLVSLIDVSETCDASCYYRMDDHLNAVGHQIFAELINNDFDNR